MHFDPDVRPRLGRKHLDRARLYSDRYELVQDLAVRRFARVAEIGIGVGAFSEFLVETLNPDYFAAFDLFHFHQLETVLGVPSAEYLNGLSHEDYYRQRIERPGLTVATFVGDSSTRLSEIPSESFDLVYVDGSHQFEGVAADTVQAVRILKPDGILVFNDYTIFDLHLNHRYGVVEVVNQLIAQTDFKVIGLGLDADMFCDIALRR